MKKLLLFAVIVSIFSSANSFAETPSLTVKNHQGPSELGKAKKAIVNKFKNLRIDWNYMLDVLHGKGNIVIVGANGVPQSADQSASNRPNEVTGPSTTDDLRAIAGNTNL